MPTGPRKARYKAQQIERKRPPVEKKAKTQELPQLTTPIGWFALSETGLHHVAPDKPTGEAKYTPEDSNL